MVGSVRASLWPDAPVVECVVDNRVFLLGLDSLYRTAIKKHDADKAEALTKWTVQRLTAAAGRIARKTADYSLVGLASRVEDPVVLAALRESVVLYARVITAGNVQTRPTFVWRVDPELCAVAERFVDAFNALFGRELPPPTAAYAHVFGSAFEELEIVGRCARLGQTPGPQAQFYHWAVVKGAGEQFTVHEFWDDELWTTNRYRGRRELRPL